MQLIVDDYTAFIGKESERFTISFKDKPKEEFPVSKVEQIVVANASGVSTGAVRLAMENDVDIVYLDWRGMPIGRTYPCRLGGTTLTRKRQLEAYFELTGAEIVKILIKSKIRNQGYFLKSLAKSRNNAEVSSAGDEIIKTAEKTSELEGTVDEIREKMLGIEGYAGNVYWGALQKVIPIEAREKKTPDETNSLFNYGYGILYSEIEKACILAGLDPYLGFLHTDRYGKPSMVLDLIEEFRPVIVDRAIVTLFAQKQVREGFFEEENGLVRLSKEGRGEVITAVMGRLHSEISFRDGKSDLAGIILHEARQVAAKVLRPEEKMHGFVYKW